MTHHTTNCAAAQAHRRLVAAATTVLRHATRDLRDGFTSSAQTGLELAAELLSLTSLLNSVLHHTVADETWPIWVERVRGIASDPHVVHKSEWRERLGVLLESILIVRWGDNGAMLVSPLPTRQARARFGAEGQVKP